MNPARSLLRACSCPSATSAMAQEAPDRRAIVVAGEPVYRF